MAVIVLTTEINADINICFDLARDVDVHKLSTAKTNERAIAGRTTGLCELGDIITWEAKHFGFMQELTVEITKFNKPNFFEDRMIRGAFHSMKHEHRFESIDGTTIMTDKFEYRVPFGILGNLFDLIILKNYMTRFLMVRNQFLKTLAEKK
jgi:ligand-binding SRPBCC domain-containing protein